MMRKVDRGSPPRSGPGKRSPRRRRRAAAKRSHDRLRTIYSVSVLSARSRIATDAVESGGIGIIVPISGNRLFPLVAHPRLWISAASTPLAYHARSMALSFLRSAHPATADRSGTSDGVLLHASSACRRGNVVERQRVIPRFAGLGDRMHCIHARARSKRSSRRWRGIRPGARSTSPVI